MTSRQKSDLKFAHNRGMTFRDAIAFASIPAALMPKAMRLWQLLNIH